MKFNKSFLVLIAYFLISSNSFYQRNQVRIVGSSTLYPFVTVAAEKFGKNPIFKTPVVESTGTGGGFKLFCSGNNLNFPDIVNSSRKIKENEIKLCNKNGVKNIEEIIIGYDGIVLATNINSENFKLTTNHIFLALSEYIPFEGKIIKNIYKNWQEIDKSLPNQKIQIYGPSFTSGTREAFIELTIAKACLNNEEIIKNYPNKNERKFICSSIREDGKYIEMGENDNMIIHKLISNQSALGILGYNFLEQNYSQIKAAEIESIYPSISTIYNQQYPISRPLYIYYNKDHLNTVKDLQPFLNELTSQEAIGKEGYLVKKGLISAQ